MFVDVFNTDRKYQVVYADPPWSYNSKHPTTAKRPSAMGVSLTPDYYYPVMGIGEIKALPVPSITDSKCVLFLWTTNPMLREGLEVVESWGFRYVTMLTWYKTNSKGMGYWFRGYTEHILFGVRGNVKSFRSQSHNLREAKFTRHSEKPALFRQMIDESAVGLSPKIELFARQQVDGWDCWGNEVERKAPRVLNRKNDEIPPDAVYVGRPTRWGNPFVVGRDGTRDEVIAMYANWLDVMVSSGELDLSELRGKDLVCWCHNWDGKGENPMYCHADVLLGLANK